jgi:hypothetical protein
MEGGVSTLKGWASARAKARGSLGTPIALIECAHSALAGPPEVDQWHPAPAKPHGGAVLGHGTPLEQ